MSIDPVIAAEIARLEYTIAMCSIDHGRGVNPQGLDIPFMEHGLLALRLYRSLANSDDALPSLSLAVNDPVVKSLRDELTTPAEKG